MNLPHIKTASFCITTRCHYSVLRQSDTSTQTLDNPAADPLTENQSEADPILFCASCLHRITSNGERIEQSQQHEHSCTNPQGYQFLIGCFRHAEGCENVGDWTSEYSWFSGYLWRYSLCAMCHSHLGWQFRNDNEMFFGLIQNRLVCEKRKQH